jgi:hypothetical protein
MPQACGQCIVQAGGMIGVAAARSEEPLPLRVRLRGT